MSALSNYLEDAIVQHFLGAGSPIPDPVPNGVFLALYTDNPGDDNSGQEASYQGYIRKACSWNVLQGNETTTNLAPITFDAKQDSGEVIIRYAGVFNAEAGGQLLFYGGLAQPKTLAQDDVIAFAANAITLSLF